VGLDEDEDDEEEELDPARHPLLRASRLPRMSKGTIDMVVGIVEEAFTVPVDMKMISWMKKTSWTIKSQTDLSPKMSGIL